MSSKIYHKIGSCHLNPAAQAHDRLKLPTNAQPMPHLFSAAHVLNKRILRSNRHGEEGSRGGLGDPAAGH